MNNEKLHINIRLEPNVRKAFRIHCAKKSTTAQKLIEAFIKEQVGPELKEMANG